MQVLASLDSWRALRRDLDDLCKLVSSKRCDRCQHLEKVAELQTCVVCHQTHCTTCQALGKRKYYTEYDPWLTRGYCSQGSWYCQDCKEKV